jgi:hypothetical protein
MPWSGSRASVRRAGRPRRQQIADRGHDGRQCRQDRTAGENVGDDETGHCEDAPASTYGQFFDHQSARPFFIRPHLTSARCRGVRPSVYATAPCAAESCAPSPPSFPAPSIASSERLSSADSPNSISSPGWASTSCSSSGLSSSPCATSSTPTFCSVHGGLGAFSSPRGPLRVRSPTGVSLQRVRQRSTSGIRQGYDFSVGSRPDTSAG